MKTLLLSIILTFMIHQVIPVGILGGILLIISITFLLDTVVFNK